MANNCAFDMRITGKEDAIKELIAMLSWQGDFENNGLGRVFSFDALELEKTNAPGIFAVTGFGDCAWSVLCSMQDYHGRHPSLESETERLGLVVEVFSVEPGCCFQEHVLIANGDVVISECVDYEEHCIEACGSLEKYNQEFNTSFTPDMVNEDGYVCIGGFGDDYGVFEDVTRFFKNEIGLSALSDLINDAERKVDVANNNFVLREASRDEI